MVLLLTWIGVGIFIAAWLLKQVDILWVVGMRRRLWKPLAIASVLTATIAAYMAGTVAVLWTLYAMGIRSESLMTPAWVWTVGVGLGLVVAGAIINMARINMHTWIRLESRGA